MKKIILCADDYGLNPAVSAGIIDLVAKRKLSATSCMTNSPHWAVAASALKPFARQIDIGLHFNLTEGRPLAPLTLCSGKDELPTLPRLLSKAFLHTLKLDEIIAELNRQINNFEANMQQLPDYIDGHQHIHQFPIIRTAIIHVCQQRFKGLPYYIRWASGLPFKAKNVAKCKRMVIYLTGGYSFKNLLQQHHIPHNQSFGGIYDFADSKQYAKLFSNFLKNIQPNGLIMCHPGLVNNDSDSIAKSRYDEYQYFNSEAFSQVCNAQQIQLTRFRDL